MSAGPTASPMPAVAVPAPRPDDPRVLRDQVAAIFTSLAPAAAGDAVIALALAIVFYLQTGRTLTFVWYALHLGQTLRMPILNRYFRDPHVAARTEYWRHVATRELAIASSAWMLAPWLLLPRGNETLAALLMVVILTMCSAGALSVAHVRSTIYAFMIPMIAGLAGWLAWQGETLLLILAACCPLYLAVAIRLALQQHALLTRALALRYQQEDLAHELAVQMENARRASEEKTRFLAAASHDLRQPVHAIALFGAVLEKELRGKPEYANAERLMSAVNALGTSLDTMLDVSQLDAGTIDAERVPVPLNTVMLSLHGMFAARAEERGLQFRVRATPLTVISDPELLRRLLANLIENAIKYTPRGGVLVVARRRHDEAWIDVWDSGIGISSENLERVFDEYFQVDNPGRDRKRGLGIGLAVVRRLANLLGHRIEVASLPGRGSRFRIRLPLAPDVVHERAVPVVATLTRPPSLPRRVLLLDDEAAIGLAVRALLGAYGVDVVAVQDEPAALEAIASARDAQAPFGALISDFRLANGADGLDAAARLRTAAGGAMPVLLLTGETSPDRLQRVRQSGLPVLFKPATADVLVATLADLAEAAAP